MCQGHLHTRMVGKLQSLSQECDSFFRSPFGKMHLREVSEVNRQGARWRDLAPESDCAFGIVQSDSMVMQRYPCQPGVGIVQLIDVAVLFVPFGCDSHLLNRFIMSAGGIQDAGVVPP